MPSRTVRTAHRANKELNLPLVVAASLVLLRVPEIRSPRPLSLDVVGGLLPSSVSAASSTP
ncbi:hypothetical protein [Kribbella antiqua]|nr:hypothetical protein [Kribbella antiqua]